MDDLHLLEKAVALVLGFIGVKLVLEFGGVEVPTGVSLEVVALLLGGGGAGGLLLPDPRKTKGGCKE